jgi:hypothetical protein
MQTPGKNSAFKSQLQPSEYASYPRRNKKNIHPNNISTTKMALASWIEYHKPLLKNEPWEEKLEKQDGLALADGCGLGTETDPDWLEFS